MRDLPLELLTQVLQLLPTHELVHRCRCVSRMWAAAAVQVLRGRGGRAQTNHCRSNKDGGTHGPVLLRVTKLLRKPPQMLWSEWLAPVEAMEVPYVLPANSVAAVQFYNCVALLPETPLWHLAALPFGLWTSWARVLPGLHSVELNNFSHQGVFELAVLVDNLPKLTVLDLRHMRVQSLQPLVRARRLQTLLLQLVQTEQHGGLATLLVHSTSLRRLHCRACKLHPDDAAALVDERVRLTDCTLDESVLTSGKVPHGLRHLVLETSSNSFKRTLDWSSVARTLASLELNALKWSAAPTDLLAGFSVCTNLVRLSCRDIDVHDGSFLRGLPSLRELAVSATDSVPSLTLPPNLPLQVLDVCSVRLPASFSATISSYERLEHFALRFCDLDIKLSLSLPRLRRLTLEYVDFVSDAVTVDIQACPVLTTVDMDHMEDVPVFGSPSPVQELHLIRSSLQQGTLSPFARLPNLRTLSLRDVPFPGPVDLSVLRQIPRLEHLDLSETPGADVAHLAECAQLVTLAFDCSATPDVSALQRCRNLRSLILSGITGALPEGLDTLHSVRIFVTRPTGPVTLLRGNADTVIDALDLPLERSFRVM